jgi:hypothetical protein
MASGQSNSYNIPYPVGTDPVNVHGDIKSLVDKLEVVLPIASYSQIKVFNNSALDIFAGMPVYITGYSNNATAVAAATASTSQPILGLAKSFIAKDDYGIVVVSGILQGINTSAFEVGDILYVGEGGGIVKVRPESSASAAVGVIGYSNPTEGIIIVEAKGNGTWGALKAGLA